MNDSRERNYAGVFDNRLGFGARPALIVIDFLQGYTSPGAPLFAEGVVRAVDESVALIAAARVAGLPVIHTRVLFHTSGLDGGLFARKVPVLRSLVPGEPLAEFDPRVAPQEDELVIVKNYASAFFGTSLAATLTAAGIDTAILIGCSTSGCIRASAIDAIQHGFRRSCHANVSAIAMTGRMRPTSSISTQSMVMWSTRPRCCHTSHSALQATPDPGTKPDGHCACAKSCPPHSRPPGMRGLRCCHRDHRAPRSWGVARRWRH